VGTDIEEIDVFNIHIHDIHDRLLQTQTDWDGNALERPRGHDVEYIMAHVTRYMENDWKVQDTAYGWD
jgi:hypothetical protein